MHRKITIIIYAVQLIVSIFLVADLHSNVESLQMIGAYLVVISILPIISFRDSGLYAWIIGITSLINVSWANSICFSSWENALNWQTDLVPMAANAEMAKSILLFYSAFIFGAAIIKPRLVIDSVAFEITTNTTVFLVGILLLFVILVFGFSGSGSQGGYVSQSNALYEYAIPIFVFTWIFGAAQSTKMKIALCVYAFLYVAQGIMHGDRSSAFPLLIVLALLIIKRRVGTIQILIFGLVAIFGANVIDILRNGQSSDVVTSVLKRGLNVNTISYSHYAGVQVIRLANGMWHPSDLMTFILNIFTGGAESLSDRASSVGFYNVGGGFTASYFYFWLGIFGVTAGGLLTGLIITWFFRKQGIFNMSVAICIIAFTIRWYVYFPIALYRSAILIPIIVFGLIRILNYLSADHSRTYFK